MFSENLAQEIQGWEEIFPPSAFNVLRLWSLWNIMQLFVTPDFCAAYEQLNCLQTEANIRIKCVGDIMGLPANAYLSDL